MLRLRLTYQIPHAVSVIRSGARRIPRRADSCVGRPAVPHTDTAVLRLGAEEGRPRLGIVFAKGGSGRMGGGMNVGITLKPATAGRRERCTQCGVPTQCNRIRHHHATLSEMQKGSIQPSREGRTAEAESSADRTHSSAGGQDQGNSHSSQGSRRGRAVAQLLVHLARYPRTASFTL